MSFFFSCLLLTSGSKALIMSLAWGFLQMPSNLYKPTRTRTPFHIKMTVYWNTVFYYPNTAIRPFTIFMIGSVMSDSFRPHGLQHTRLSITNSWSLLNLMSIESVMPSNDLILCHPLLLLSFPAPGYFPMSVLHIRWPKYWSFSFSISPSNEHLGLISFRMDCLDLLAVQGTLKSLLQHHNLKASILWRSTFFMVQHSHLYKTIEKKKNTHTKM